MDISKDVENRKLIAAGMCGRDSLEKGDEGRELITADHEFSQRASIAANDGNRKSIQREV